MIHVIDKHDCCGCSACVQKCPKRCITMREDDEGFLYPEVNGEDCINCGLCEKVCPLLKKTDKRSPSGVFAVKNRNDNDRLEGSSGGVFIALARDVISDGGVVFGAVFDSEWEVRHVCSETLDGLKAMTSSKYLQSRIEDTYSEAQRYLETGRKVMFVGTPCQIAGLHGFLRHDYVNLLTVDILCHGVPSPGIWRRYLSDVFGKTDVFTNSSVDYKKMITSVNFREKTARGWHNYSIAVHGKTDLNAEKATLLLSESYMDNLFMCGFLNDMYLRPSCYRCKCKQGRSKSDLTLADYWGVKTLMPDFSDDIGASLVMVNTEKGAAALATSGLETRSTDLSSAVKYNGGFKSVIREPKRRKEFFRLLLSGVSFAEVVKKTVKTPFYKKAYRNARRALRRILFR